MIVSVDEMKNYLRVDTADDDALIASILSAAVQLCMDVARVSSEERLSSFANSRIAVMYAAAYLYEHREEADHKALTLTLRALLGGEREEGF